jgi:hypothetical protein
MLLLNEMTYRSGQASWTLPQAFLEEFFDRLEDKEYGMSFEDAVGPYPENGNVDLALSANEIYRHVNGRQLDTLLAERRSGKVKDSANDSSSSRDQRGRRGDKPMGSATRTTEKSVFCNWHKGYFAVDANHSTENCRAHLKGWKITPHPSPPTPQ